METQSRQTALRGYGNAINAEVAINFIVSYLDVEQSGELDDI